jgi:hypothetical protein
VSEVSGATREPKFQGYEAMARSMKSKFGPTKRTATSKSQTDTKLTNMPKFKSNDKSINHGASKRNGGSSTTKALNQLKKTDAFSRKMNSKISMKQSENSFAIDERDEEDSESEVITLKNYKTAPKKGTTKEIPTYDRTRSAFKIKKKPKRLYGILGVDKLNPDDNILLRGNINSKKENSLSLATTHITKTDLKNQHDMFHNVDKLKMLEKIHKNENELTRIRKMKILRSVSAYILCFRELRKEYRRTHHLIMI